MSADEWFRGGGDGGDVEARDRRARRGQGTRATSPRPTGSATSSPPRAIVLEDGPGGTTWRRE